MTHKSHTVIIAATMMPFLGAIAKADDACIAAPEKQALKILRFHGDGDARAEIERGSMHRIGSVASLVGNRRFEVIEAEGSIYKGEYRIRLIYAPVPGDCVLMGQEIFERSDPY